MNEIIHIAELLSSSTQSKEAADINLASVVYGRQML